MPKKPAPATTPKITTKKGKDTQSTTPSGEGARLREQNAAKRNAMLKLKNAVHPKIAGAKELHKPFSELAAAVRTMEQDEVFLDLVSDNHAIRYAAARAGYGFRNVYEWIEQDPEFEKMVKLAQKSAVQKMETEADRRGMEGIDKPVYYKGECVDYTKEYSDSLLMMRLKALDPDKYKDRSASEISAPGGAPLLPDRVEFEFIRPSKKVKKDD